MKRYWILFLGLFCTVYGQDYGQDYAVINDPDGYTNVRALPNSKSKIVGKIVEGELFFIFPEQGSWDDDVLPDPNWITVEFGGGTSSYSESVKARMDKLGIPPRKEAVQGYIHRSRVKSIYKMKALNAHKISENFMVYSEGNNHFLLMAGKFDPASNKVEKKEGMGVVKVNGKAIWGTDGTMPRTEFKWIKQVKGDKVTELPLAWFRHFYEPSMYPTPMKMFADGKGSFFLYMENSDGAGSYRACLYIRDGEILSSHAFLPF